MSIHIQVLIAVPVLLLPLSGAGEPLFERIPAGEAGIDFVYDWSPPERYEHELVNGVTGGGAAAGDYDGDGLIDLFLTQPFGGNRLYRNRGDFRFERDESIEDDAWGTGAVFVDIDNDGDLDLFVCGYDCPNRLHLNQGDRFVEVAARAGLALPGANVAMAFADYDRDGDLDGYLLTNHIAPRDPPLWKYETRASDGMPILPESLEGIAKVLYRPDTREGRLVPAGEPDRLLRNEGPGPDGVPRFTDATEGSGIRDQGFGLGVVWLDINGDRFPDLYAANDFWGQDHLYRNNGDGTFTDITTRALPHTPWFSMGCDSADINNDGLPDLMASDMSSATHYREKLSMGDMQGWFLETAVPRQYMRNALYINTGTTRFMESAHLSGVASTDWTWSVRFADLDGDGRQDLHVSNGAERFWDNSDLMREARGAQRIDTEELKALWLSTPPRNDPNYAFRNAGNLRFEEMGARWGLREETVSYGVVVEDLDGDGDPDLITNNFDGPPSLFRNRAAERNRFLRLRLRGTRSNRMGLGASVRLVHRGRLQTRYLTSARGYMSGAAPVLRFGLGPSDAPVDSLTIDWPSGLRQEIPSPSGTSLTVTEPGEGPEAPPRRRPRPLFALSQALLPVGRRETPFDDFARQPLLPHRHSGLGPGIAWADADGDGFEDFHISRPAGHGGMVHLWRPPAPESGEPRFVVESIHPFAAHADREDMTPLFLDIDGDGDRDLFVASGGVEREPGDPYYRDRLYLNRGDGTFTPAPDEALPPDLLSSGPACAADIDRDGDLDLFVGSRIVPGRYPTPPRSRLLRNENGRLVHHPLPESLTGMITSALWTDIDRDGWPDLMVVGEWMAPRLYRNHGGTLRQASAGLQDLRGWWNAIAGADLDGDGDQDFVLGNFGWNTKYRASPARPAQIFHGDMDGSGRSRIVEAKLAEGLLLPVRGKSCSQNAMPVLRDRFPTFHSFALATLPDIYGTEPLRQALHLTATTLDTGILWNRSEGDAFAFDFAPLPVEAQIAPVFAPLLCDFDADGHIDIFLSQNFFGPQAETGRMDGGVGLLLLGEGGRDFRPLPAHHSGIVAPLDGRAAAMTDLDRDLRPDIVVANQSGPVLAFLNRTSAPHRLAIRLAGRPGNPDATGARVRIEHPDGRTPTWEIRTGESHMTQSSPVIHTGWSTRPPVIHVTWPDGRTTSRQADRSPSLTISRP